MDWQAVIARSLPGWLAADSWEGSVVLNGHSYGGVAIKSREAVKFLDAEAAVYRALLTELGLAK